MKRIQYLTTATTNIGAITPNFDGQRLEFIFVQDATGGRALTWDASYVNPPQPNLAANAVTSVKFISFNGTTWQYEGGLFQTLWAPIVQAHVNLSGAAAGTYLGHNAVTEDLLVGAASPATAAGMFQRIDPADYAIPGKTMQMRLIATYNQNNVALGAGITLTAGLYPVSTTGSTTTLTTSFGTVVTGSTAAVTNIAAQSDQRVVSSTFAAPTADTYAFGVVASGTTGGFTKIGLRLEYRMV